MDTVILVLIILCVVYKEVLRTYIPYHLFSPEYFFLVIFINITNGLCHNDSRDFPLVPGTGTVLALKMSI